MRIKKYIIDLIIDGDNGYAILNNGKAFSFKRENVKYLEFFDGEVGYFEIFNSQTNEYMYLGGKYLECTSEQFIYIPEIKKLYSMYYSVDNSICKSNCENMEK